MDHCKKSSEKQNYDDGNIPEIDLPKTSNATTEIPDEFGDNIPKPDESTRPRQDGPGGN